MNYRPKTGSPIEFECSLQEALLFLVVQYLINFQPKEIDRVLFNKLNYDYSSECFVVLKERIKSLREKNHSSYLMAQAAQPRGKLMGSRLDLCTKLMQLIQMPYSSIWEFWLEVEEDWKINFLEIANQSAKDPKYTKGEINYYNRKFKQTLSEKKNPHKQDKTPHLFKMVEASLKLIDHKSKFFSEDFLINYWNPFINAVKTWSNFEEKGLVLDNGQRAGTVALRLKPETEALVAVTGGRTEKTISQPPQKNLSGRGRKKSENKPNISILSITLPEEYEREESFRRLKEFLMKKEGQK